MLKPLSDIWHAITRLWPFPRDDYWRGVTLNISCPRDPVWRSEAAELDLDRWLTSLPDRIED